MFTEHQSNTSRIPVEYRPKSMGTSGRSRPMFAFGACEYNTGLANMVPSVWASGYSSVWFFDVEGLAPNRSTEGKEALDGPQRGPRFDGS